MTDPVATLAWIGLAFGLAIVFLDFLTERWF